MKRLLNWTITNIRRLIIGVVGGTVLLIGIIMIVTPGPAVVVIPLGLTILASEFIWARALLLKVQDRLRQATSRKNNKNNPLDKQPGN